MVILQSYLLMELVLGSQSHIVKYWSPSHQRNEIFFCWTRVCEYGSLSVSILCKGFWLSARDSHQSATVYVSFVRQLSFPEASAVKKNRRTFLGQSVPFDSVRESTRKSYLIHARYFTPMSGNDDQGSVFLISIERWSH